ncbi:MAG: queuosine precursor transporter [Acidobacteria bacterium]|nr:queuosine precursor transporter [Acidobacteriota bacterium]
MKGLIQRITARDQRLGAFRHYEILVQVYVVVLLISNLVGQKLSAFGPFRVSGAQLLFPITYIFSDIFTEVYGYAGSRRAIWIAFFANALMALMGVFMVWIPAAPEWPAANQEAFRLVFGAVPRMIVASLLAFWAGEFANSFVMAKMKIWTQGRWLWTRTIGSTVAGQALDSLIVTAVFFWGTVPWTTVLVAAGSGYLFKVAYEALATPLTYGIVAWLKRSEGVDLYDEGTDFNPFRKA